ncbi:hypothetical protein CCMA1212_008977 [Trichoderma ghanense]|uniref:Uncharacterized protein n=1 Tax=Trichoderma ghanense TaxID=65468 RepID=A0ABY2GTL1_9HYPO
MLRIVGPGPGWPTAGAGGGAAGRFAVVLLDGDLGPFSSQHALTKGCAPAAAPSLKAVARPGMWTMHIRHSVGAGLLEYVLDLSGPKKYRQVDWYTLLLFDRAAQALLFPADDDAESPSF